jgi:hypothetical protein
MRARADDLALVLGDGRQDMDRQLVRVGIIDGDEFHLQAKTCAMARFYEPRLARFTPRST